MLAYRKLLESFRPFHVVALLIHFFELNSTNYTVPHNNPSSQSSLTAYYHLQSVNYPCYFWYNWTMNLLYLSLFLRGHTTRLQHINPLAIMQCFGLAARISPLCGFCSAAYFFSLNQSYCDQVIPTMCAINEHSQASCLYHLCTLKTVILFCLKGRKQTIMRQLLEDEWAVVWFMDILDCTISVLWSISENSQKHVFEKYSADVCTINEWNYRHCMPAAALLVMEISAFFVGEPLFKMCMQETNSFTSVYFVS